MKTNLKQENIKQISSIFIFCIGVLTLFTMYDRILLTTLIIILISFVSLKILNDKQTTQLYVTAATLGPVGEIIAIHIGIWTYTIPSIYGIPYWLPFLWGLAIVHLDLLLNQFKFLIGKIRKILK